MSHLLFADQAAGQLTSAIGAYLWLLFLLSAIGWCVVAWRFQQQGELLPFEEHTAVPWGVLEVAVMLCIWIASMLAGLAAASQIGGFELGVKFEDLDAGQRVLMITLPAFAHWLAIAAFLGWLRFNTRASWSDLGLNLREIGKDLQLGVVAFVLIVPPVILLQTYLASLFPEQQHPLIEALRKHSDYGLIAAVCFTAVLSAPVLEEVMYRLVIQGWLERLLLVRREVGEVKSPASAPGQEQISENSEVSVSTRPEASPYASPRSTTAPEASTNRPRSHQRGWSWVAAIAITSLLFAGAHIGHGPAPISLFFFALGLGYLYQRTHRLLPCIVVHGLLNLQTTIILLAGVQAGEAAVTVVR